MNIAKWHSSQKTAQQRLTAHGQIVVEVHGPSYTLVRGSPRIKDDIIREIRRHTLYDSEALAEKYGIPDRKVRSIIKRKCYYGVW